MHPYSLFTTANLVICFHRLPSRQWFLDALGVIRTFYRFASADDLESYFYEGRRFNSRCLLRFDDGDRSFYECAFPVLKDLAIPAILFVSPKVLSGGFNYWFQEMARFQRLLPDARIKETIGAVTGRPIEEILGFGVFPICKSLPSEEMQEILGVLRTRAGAGFERSLNISAKQLEEISRSRTIAVGAHTLNHPILANEDDGAAAAEIGQSVSDLSGMLKKNIRHFAYPNGLRGLDFGDREKKVLKARGIRLAYSGDTGFFGGKTDPFEVPCLGISGDRGSKRLKIIAKFLLAPVWDRMAGKKEIRERVFIRKYWRKAEGSAESLKSPEEKSRNGSEISDRLLRERNQ